MPDRENYPTPEDFKVEVDTFLASAVDLRILIAVLVIDILFERVCEKAGPTGPEGVVEYLQPVSKENLP